MLPPVFMVVRVTPPIVTGFPDARSMSVNATVAAFAIPARNPNVVRAAARVRTDFSSFFIFCILFGCWLLVVVLRLEKILPNSSLVGGNGEKVQTLFIAGIFEGYDAGKVKFFAKNWALQQNLWVNFGSGSFPSV
jgi:hypothetical protein